MTTAHTDYIEKALAEIPLFVHLNNKQRKELKSLMTPVEVKAGYHLTEEGAIGREFGVIIEGEATVDVHGEKVATLKAGEFYGEVALLEEIGHHQHKRMATVMATTDMVVGVLSVNEFRTLIADIPEIADSVKRAAADRAGNA